MIVDIATSLASKVAEVTFIFLVHSFLEALTRFFFKIVYT